MHSLITITDSFLQHVNSLETPIWIFDIEQESMWWANPPAVILWGADDKESLLQRNFSDMTDASRAQLGGYLNGFKNNQRFVKRWSFYPNRIPQIVDCSCSGIYLPNNRLAMLVEGRAVHPQEIEANILLMTEALRHTNTIVSVYSLEGKPLTRNPSAIMAYGEATTSSNLLWNIPTDTQISEALREALFNNQVFSTELLVNTLNGKCWHGLDARKIKDPITADDCILVNERDITIEHQAVDTLKSNEMRLEGLFNFSKVGIALTEFETGTFLRTNNALTAITGYSHEELQRLNYWNIIPEEYSTCATNRLEDLLKFGSCGPYEEEHIHKKGSRYSVSVKSILLKDLSGKRLVWSIIEDITKRKENEEKLMLSANVFTHVRESITITDATAIIIDVNDTFTCMTGFSREEAIGQNSRILQSGRKSTDFYVVMWQALLKDDYWSGEIWNRRKNGEVYVEMKTISAVQNEQGITTHYIGLGTDITPMKEYQDKLEHIAHYDILTHLPNRSLLADRLSQAMLQCSRHEKSLAVIFLDLDGFKYINDAHGHNVGDELLIALSFRMNEVLREGDTLARVGGDEFVAVLADLARVEDCEPVLERLLLAASQPVIVDNVVVKVSASIGVTLYPQDNVDTDLLIRHADQAMYEAKESGKNRYRLFDTVQNDAAKERRESLEYIRSALDNHQFVLHYQPKVNMRTGTVTGVEALIRWQHPERGLLNPIEFLPVIENDAMSIEVGEWVIDTALTQISQWQEIALNLPVSISVNIAAVQLQQFDFADKLAILLATHPDVEPRYLELEVLETSALDDVQQVSTIMNSCIALGVSFSLDDFGTGYSSLTHLRRLPVKLIKIDQSFVRDMLVDADDLSIVEGVIALAKSFKLDVLAEGVETIEHGTALVQLGCDLAQGYSIARPMPASDILAWMSDWKPDDTWHI